MSEITIIYWRDIPAQVVAKQGRATAKRQLSPRFQEAIDQAAMRGGAHETEAYLAEWHRVGPKEVEADHETAASAEAARLEAEYDDARLKRLARNGGREGTVERLVVFTPSGKRGRFADGTTILQAARQLGVDLDSVCGGRGICGRCQIVVTEGEFAKHGIKSAAGHVSAVNDVETRYAQKRGLHVERRLGCQAQLCGDAVIDVPPDSQVHRPVVRKSADERPIEIDPVVHLHYVEVAQPDMHDPRSDARRLREALAATWNLGEVEIGLDVLARLQHALRQGNWTVTVAVRHGKEVVAVYPGFKERVYGVAVDIGSTTIAAHLCDLATGAVLGSAGIMNPQIRFGEDLMSRVSYVMMHPGGDKELTQVVRSALDSLIGSLTQDAKITREDVVELSFAGNCVMHHLLLGIDPTELGGAPFALAFDHGIDTKARELGLAIAPGGTAFTLPCVAGHVGADAAGVVLAEAPHLAEEITLVIDVGTNAEIVLGNRERLLACSSPTGPAFEGAQISAGQRAAPGAIERVRIDPATLEPRFKVIGCDAWSDQPEFPRGTRVTGICGSGIIEAIAEMLIAGIVTADGVIDGALAARTKRVQAEGRTFSYLIREGEPRITVTQADIRAIQLAKAALYAGAKLLMRRYGVDNVERIKLAGAFGSHIDPFHAMVLGLVPDCDLAKVSAVGNAAGHGARIALVNAAARREIEDIVRRIEKIETAVDPAFQEEFVAAMAFPHARDAFPHLAARVTLPARTSSPRAGRRRRS